MGLSDDEPANFMEPYVHVMTVGSLTILARVTNGPGTIHLNAPDQRAVNSALGISGTITPSDAASPITIEYRPPSGQSITRIVQTDGNGAYTDTFTPTTLGTWKVQSWWPGDNAHDPVESSTRTIAVKKPMGS